MKTRRTMPVLGENIPKNMNFFLPWLGKFVFTIFGWGFKNELPNIPKFVAALGPHTSNWDFVFGLAGLFSLGIKISWMGKRTIFRKPFVKILRWIGGIPIERSASSGVVNTMIDRFNNSNQFILALAPEGTRSKVDKWRTGFYHIANSAGVPILMVCFDYKHKVISFGPLLYPSGDVESDINKMRNVFSNIQGKKPK